MHPTASHDSIQEMYEFFAFSDALEDGLSPAALIENQAAEGEAHLEKRKNELTAYLNELIEANENEREELVKEASDLTPKEAQLYHAQLSQRVKDLKDTVSKQEEQFHLAEKTTRELHVQNSELIASIMKMRGLIKSQQDKQSDTQSELLKAGKALSQYVANPSQRGNHHDSKYPRSSSSHSSRRF